MCRALMCLLPLLEFSVSWGTGNNVGAEGLVVRSRQGLAEFLGEEGAAGPAQPFCWWKGPCWAGLACACRGDILQRVAPVRWPGSVQMLAHHKRPQGLVDAQHCL